jgi:hypothetical protein
MATKGNGFFDARGQFFKTPEEATLSDIAAVLGRVGEGDSLAPGLAKIIMEKREDIQRIFSDHDKMTCNNPIMPELRTVK